MKCIEARRMVTPFIKRELPEKDEEEFLRHVERCADCMDELETYFMVYKALDTLDEGTHSEYDFRKMLNDEIKAAKRGILRKKAVRAAGCLLFAAVEVLLLFSVYTGYLAQRNLMREGALQRMIGGSFFGNEPPAPAAQTEQAGELETWADEMLQEG